MSVTATVSLARHQTTKERCRIFHLGLDARETLVIESLFRTHPELSCRFVFGAPQAGDPVDLVFVNGDDIAALRSWEGLHRERPEVVAIVATSDERDFGAMRVIRKPLNFRNFVLILDAITSTDSREAAMPASGDTLRVLLVDDSFPARQYMKLKLEELSRASGLPLQIDMADCAEKALDVAQQQHYDLAFLDVVMPGMDGYEACARLKALHPMRVAMLTSRAASVDFMRGRSAGCDNYLSKPANDADLRTILQLTALKKLGKGKAGP